MAAPINDWLSTLKHSWKCTECSSTEIGINAPTDCECGNRHFYYNGCAERVSGVISDSLSDLVNPVDNKVYDSKSAYYQKLKETGHHVYEGTPSGKKVLNKGDHNVSKELKEACQKAGVI